jgi:multiple sugar transport system substrate-binding protein
MNGEASMMMNWPFMWDPLNDRQTSPLTGKVQTSLLPAGPAGTASIDGADAWTISAATKQQDLATRLVSFFLGVEMQVQQAVATGWLPIRRSAYGDERVTRACPQAKVVAEQAEHPYSSFLTPDYDAITEALGREIVKALAGKETPKVALAVAEHSVNAIVNARD